MVNGHSRPRSLQSGKHKEAVITDGHTAVGPLTRGGGGGILIWHVDFKKA